MRETSDTPTETEDEYTFVAEFAPDGDVEVRILMMILNYPESEIERVLANVRLNSGD